MIVWALVAAVLACIIFVIAVKGLTALQIAILYSPLPEEDGSSRLLQEEDGDGKQQTICRCNTGAGRLFAKWSKP
jgi:hypothetical protein